MVQVINGFEISVDGIKRPFGNIERMVNSITPWQDVDNFILLKFEDLVGPKGGSTEELQFESIDKILNHINANQFNIEDIAIKSFGKPGTFRKGKINRWKIELDNKEKELFKKYDDYFVSLGYEPTT